MALPRRHLMEPDPDTPAPSVGFVLWLFAFLLGVLVTLLQIAA